MACVANQHCEARAGRAHLLPVERLLVRSPRDFGGSASMSAKALVPVAWWGGRVGVPALGNGLPWCSGRGIALTRADRALLRGCLVGVVGVVPLVVLMARKGLPVIMVSH